LAITSTVPAPFASARRLPLLDMQIFALVR